MRTRMLAVAVVAACVGAVGCATYDPYTGRYYTTPGAQVAAGGLAFAGGAALGAALADDDDWGWGGGDVHYHNHYHRNRNTNVNVNRNVNRGGGGGRRGGGRQGGGRRR